MIISNYIYSLFNLDTLAIAMAGLVCFIGSIAIIFAARYLQGDSRRQQLLVQMGLLVITVAAMSAADNIVLFIGCWSISNLLLIRLMTHKPSWRAAANAGKLAASTFAIGLFCMAAAFTVLHLATNEVSIQKILVEIQSSQHASIAAACLILIAAMTQSAIWPFHRWLLSSLNSPTPVSAIMHAGLVNGGGFLLARFSPLFTTNYTLLTVIFTIGLITACLGSLWKLIQHDVKRMLACSTMGQMGFMLAQCGLGLFAAAIVHLCWHGMFKANLFLSANSAAQEKRFTQDNTYKLSQLAAACLIGLIGGLCFTLAMKINQPIYDTRIIIIVLSIITGTQLALAFLTHTTWKKYPVIALVVASVSFIYGYCIYTLESILPASLSAPIPINIFHLIGMLILVSAWLMVLFKNLILKQHNPTQFYSSLYMQALNASQPHPATTTAVRRHYQYE